MCRPHAWLGDQQQFRLIDFLMKEGDTWFRIDYVDKICAVLNKQRSVTIHTVKYRIIIPQNCCCKLNRQLAKLDKSSTRNNPWALCRPHAEAPSCRSNGDRRGLLSATDFTVCVETLNMLPCFEYLDIRTSPTFSISVDLRCCFCGIVIVNIFYL